MNDLNSLKGFDLSMLVRQDDMLFNIHNLTYADFKTLKEVDIRELPYKYADTIEAVYTANYFLDRYNDRYGLNDEQCLHIGFIARELMSDYLIPEDDAIEGALEREKIEPKFDNDRFFISTDGSSGYSTDNLSKAINVIATEIRNTLKAYPDRYIDVTIESYATKDKEEEEE